MYQATTIQKSQTSQTEVVSAGTLPFLDVLVNYHLNALSDHHPAQKNGAMKFLVQTAIVISEPGFLSRELVHVTETLTKTTLDTKFSVP